MWRYRQPGVAFQLLNELQRQQQCNILCDTLLQTEGMSVPVHSCILAAFSPFLYRELSTTPTYPMGPRRLIRVPAVGAQALLKLISYLYSGEMKGLGPTEHNDVKAAFIRLGMSHLIHKFEEDSRQWRGIDRGLLLELEGGTPTGTENGSASIQPSAHKSVDHKATQTEAESTVHAATQTSRRDERALLNQWLPPSSDGHESVASISTQSADVSPTPCNSTFVILTPVSDPSVNSDNVASCQVSLMSSPTVHCDPALPHFTKRSETLNPSFENHSDDLIDATAHPNGSVVSTLQADEERANTHVYAVTASEDMPGEQRAKGGASKRSSAKVRRSERLKEKEVPAKDKACMSDEPVKELKMKFKRKCKNALWQIERPAEDPAMTATLSMSVTATAAAATQKDPINRDEGLNGSPAVLPPHNPTSDPSLTQAASHQAGPSIQNKGPLSPTHYQPEECDEQMDKLLDDIMMDLNFLLPIPTERVEGRLQQRPLSYLPSHPPGLDSAPWLGEADVSMANTQMEKGVGSDLMLGTSFAEGVASANEQSSCRFGQVQGWTSSGKLSSLGPMSKGNGPNIPCMPDLEEMRLRSCLSPLHEDEKSHESRPIHPPWLSLTPVDLRLPLSSIFHKSTPVTGELDAPAVTKKRRQKTLLLNSETGISGQMTSSKEEENLDASPVVTRKKSLEKESAREREKSLKKGLRKLIAKRKNCETTLVEMSTGVGLQNTDYNVRKRRRSSTALTTQNEDLPEVTRQKHGGSSAKSVVGLESKYNAGVPKRKPGRPRKNRIRSPVLSPSAETAVRDAGTTRTPERLTSKTHGHKQWTQITSKHRQGQGEYTDSLTNGKSQDDARSKTQSDYQSPTSSSRAVTKLRSEQESCRKDSLAASVNSASVAQVKTNASTATTPTPSQTLKRFRELLERKGYLMKRKRSAADEGDVQNHQCLEKNMSTPNASAEAEKSPEETEAPVQCPLNRPFSASKTDTNNQLAPPEITSPRPGAKASRARKWTEGSTGSCDEEEEDPEDEDLEGEVDVLSGSPVSLPVFECALVGREPSDVEDVDEDVDILTVDID